MPGTSASGLKGSAIPSDAQAMKVSVILYVYNGGDYLTPALDSILAQSHTDFELCVVDDGSTDQTPEVLAAAQTRDTRVRVERQEHHGSDRLHETFNNTLAMTRHDLIAIANADDIWRQDKLETQVRSFADDPDLDICHHEATFIDAKGRVTHGSFRNVPTQLPSMPPRAWQFVRGNPIPNPTVMFRRSILSGIGLQEVGQMHDHQFWFKATVHGCRFLGLPDRLIRYRVHDQSESTATSKKNRIRDTHRACATMMVDRYGIELIIPELTLADDPDSKAWAWSFIGVLHWSSKAFDEAREAWTRALRLSDNPAVLGNLGLAALVGGDRLAARRLLRTAGDAGIENARVALESPELAVELVPVIWHGPPPAVAELVGKAERGELLADSAERTEISDMFTVVPPSANHADVKLILTRAIYERTAAAASLTVFVTCNEAAETVIGAHEELAAGATELAELPDVTLRLIHDDEIDAITAAYLMEGSTELSVIPPTLELGGPLKPQQPVAAALLLR